MMNGDRNQSLELVKGQESNKVSSCHIPQTEIWEPEGLCPWELDEPWNRTPGFPWPAVQGAFSLDYGL